MEATVTPATGRSPNSAVTCLYALRGPPTRPFWRRGAGGRARGHHAVGHPAARHDLALLVHRQGLDRCGADVDANGDRVRIGTHESDTGVMITSLSGRRPPSKESYAHDIAPPKALVTAAVNGTRSSTSSTAGRYVLDLARPAQPAHLQRRATGAERVAARGRTSSSSRAIRARGALGTQLNHRGCCSCRRPERSGRPGCHARGVPCSRPEGRNQTRWPEFALALLFAATAADASPAQPRRPQKADRPRRKIPYQRYRPRSWPGRRWARLGPVRRRCCVALRAASASRRPRPRPIPPDATSSIDELPGSLSMHFGPRAGDRGATGMQIVDADAFARMRDGVVDLTPPGRDPRHRTRSWPPSPRARSVPPD